MKTSKGKEKSAGKTVESEKEKILAPVNNTAREPNAFDYTAVIRSVKDGDTLSFVGRFKELGRSAVAEGTSPEMTLSELYQNGQMLLDDLFESHEPLPLPEPERDWESFSGKITIRIARSLHCKLFDLAEAENVSLNSMISTILSWGAEYKHCELRPITVPTISLSHQQSYTIIGQTFITPSQPNLESTYGQKGLALPLSISV